MPPLQIDNPICQEDFCQVSFSLFWGVLVFCFVLFYERRLHFRKLNSKRLHQSFQNVFLNMACFHTGNLGASSKVSNGNKDQDIQKWNFIQSQHKRNKC
jgi:hypothetical protein